MSNDGLASNGWGVVLANLGRLEDDDLHRLKALGITTVEDLVSLTGTDPRAIGTLLPNVDVRSVEADLMNESPLMQLSGGPQMADVDFFWFGALLPSELEAPTAITGADLTAALSTMPADLAAAPAGPDPTTTQTLQSCLRPIRCQEDRPTCVGHAAVAVLECALVRRGGAATDLSPQLVYWDCKEHDGLPQAEGTLIRIAMERLLVDGVCQEDEWPYNPVPDPASQGQGPPPTGWEELANRNRPISTTQLASRSSAAFRQAIDAGSPIAFSVPVYASSEDVKVWQNPTGKISMPLPGTTRVGGHAMAAVGYQPDLSAPGGGFLIIRNSWGTRFAAASPFGAGYGALPYAYIDRYGGEAWILT